MSRLVAERLNNNQVAARMYISTPTVAHHLRQAFRKLQIASRVELARIVIEEAAGSWLSPPHLPKRARQQPGAHRGLRPRGTPAKLM